MQATSYRRKLLEGRLPEGVVKFVPWLWFAHYAFLQQLVSASRKQLTA